MAHAELRDASMEKSDLTEAILRDAGLQGAPSSRATPCHVASFFAMRCAVSCVVARAPMCVCVCFGGGGVGLGAVASVGEDIWSRMVQDSPGWFTLPEALL